MLKVLKFGSSALATAEDIKQVKKIIDRHSPCVAIVSSMGNVSREITGIFEDKKDVNTVEAVKKVVTLHEMLAVELFSGSMKEEVLRVIHMYGNELLGKKEEILSVRDHLVVLSLRLSAYLMATLLECDQVDGAVLLKVSFVQGVPRPDIEQSVPLIQRYFSTVNRTVVMTGGIGSISGGAVIPFGPGGADYTAAVVAMALKSGELDLWTTVDGFMTADPAIVKKAYPVAQMSYAEAIELSHFGAKVIYAPALQPLSRENIPVRIRNIHHPEATGTLITNATVPSQVLIKGISSIPEIDLITLQGTAMVGVPGTSMRLFGALAKGKINVILITQASSEYSITFAVLPSDTGKALQHIREEFYEEIENKKELNILVEKSLSVIAIVGEQMKNTPGISANLFRSLARNGISVIAVAQGSSELNISIAIRKEFLVKAMNAIHEGFFLTGYKELNIFVVGTGVVGGALLRQIHRQQPVLMKTHRLKIQVAGIANIDRMIFDEEGIKLDRWEKTIKEKGEPVDMDKFVAVLKKMNLRNSVFVDCTGHPDPASRYLDLLSSFVSVVTPNKIAASSDYAHYCALLEAAKSHNVKFLFETNVGAGLPVINTINDLIMSGDRIIRIEAVLSGTLNYIFNTLSADMPLSETIKQAKEKGYSEPDPRIDLSGTDVVRKILILSRIAGYPMEKEDIVVKPFLPAECFEGTLEDFFLKVKKYDEMFEKQRQKLQKENKRWRFVARLDEGKATVQLMEVGSNHPAYVLEGSNNIIIITTERYKELPMVIKGYGAGAEVTAAGVFADIIRCANL